MDYFDWVRDYPGFLILMREWGEQAHRYFYSAYGDYAVVVHNVMGYQLKESHGTRRCSGPNYERIGDALRNNNVPYMVVTTRDILATWSNHVIPEQPVPEEPRTETEIEPEEQASIGETNQENAYYTFTIRGNLDQFMSVVRFCIEQGYEFTIEGANHHAPAEEDIVETTPEQIEDTIQYSDSQSIIGVNSTFTVKDLHNGTERKFKLVSPNIEYRYIGAGGAYYGARTERITDTTAGTILTDGTMQASVEGALGQAALGKRVRDIFEYQVGNTHCKYVIIDVDQSIEETESNDVRLEYKKMYMLQYTVLYSELLYSLVMFMKTKSPLISGPDAHTL